VSLERDGALGWKKNAQDPAPTVQGQWTCPTTKPRHYLLSWQHGVTDTMTLSQDKTTLSGTNRFGVQVVGHRIR